MTYGGAIIGVGETRVGRHPGRTGIELQAEAVRHAVADAGLTKDRIDAVFTLGSYIQPMTMHSMSVCEFLGLTPRIQASIDAGGTVAFIAMACHALELIDSGEIETAVCTYGDNAASRRPPGTHGYINQVEYGTEDFEDPFGQTVLASYAIMARRYLDIYGLDAETALAPIAIAIRKNAILNENAAHRRPITIESYRASEMIADPFRKLDCSPLVDGAGAFVVASRKAIAAGGGRHTPISVLGVGRQFTHKIVSQSPDLPDLGMAVAGQRAYAAAGLSPKDVDVTQLHDGFTASIAIVLEQLSLCPPGETWKYAAAGELNPGGSVPTNTHGGLLAGHVGGVLHMVETIRQLQGRAGAQQVPEAEIAMLAGIGGVLSMSGAMLLGKGL